MARIIKFHPTNHTTIELILGRHGHNSGYRHTITSGKNGPIESKWRLIGFWLPFVFLQIRTLLKRRYIVKRSDPFITKLYAEYMYRQPKDKRKFVEYISRRYNVEHDEVEFALTDLLHMQLQEKIPNLSRDDTL